MVEEVHRVDALAPHQFSNPGHYDIMKERDSLLREFERMESTQEWKELSEMDAYLASPQNRPGAGTSLEVMRELVRTSKAAVKVAAVRERFP